MNKIDELEHNILLAIKWLIAVGWVDSSPLRAELAEDPVKYYFQKSIAIIREIKKDMVLIPKECLHENKVARPTNKLDVFVDVCTDCGKRWAL